MGIRIVSTGRALPTYEMTNDEMSLLVDTDDEWIYTRTGIKSRHICKEETCVSLACEAAKKALGKSGLPAESIGTVIVATTTNDHAFPSVACMIQKNLGLPEELIAFDISAACSGFIFALASAHGFLDPKKDTYALVVGSEKLSGIVDYTDRSSCILFGDGAGAAIIKADGYELVHRSWCRGDLESLYCEGVGTDAARLKMKGKNVFKFAITALKQAIDEVIAADGEDMATIDAVICHQANARIIENVMKKYPEISSKSYMNIERYGNTSAASIPIALDELMENDKLKPGMKVLCVGFGAGLTWTGLILRV